MVLLPSPYAFISTLRNRIGRLIPFFLFLAIAGACTPDEGEKEPEKTFEPGKNRFTTQIDGDEREYYVHVPNSYDGKTAVPLVFMLHGTSGDGLKFYENSGWTEVGEAENILTVFPSSWRYCIVDEGLQKNTTKWNVLPAEWYLCNGQKARDDIKFLRTIISEMGKRYNINARKIYVVGFSNGGQMAAKCSIEMSDVLAAVVENAGSFSLDTTYTPMAKIPVTLQIGNEDFGPGVTGKSVPMNLNSLLTKPDFFPHRTASTHVKSFELNPNFTVSGDTTRASVALYTPKNANEKHYFQYVLVKGLGHAYPNGDNHWMEAAKLHWEWMKQFSK